MPSTVLVGAQWGDEGKGRMVDLLSQNYDIVARYQGGDTGHGSRTYFRIQDLGSTDIQAHVLGKYGDEGFEVSLGGDCELETVITALKFITKVLEDQSKEVYD